MNIDDTKLPSGKDLRLLNIYTVIIFAALVGTWIGYSRYAHTMIEKIYNGESVAILNALIVGQSHAPLAAYLSKTDALFYSTWPNAMFCLFMIPVFFRLLDVEGNGSSMASSGLFILLASVIFVKYLVLYRYFSAEFYLWSTYLVDLCSFFVLFLSWEYLLKRRRILVAALFLFFITTRFEVLFYPPYWDCLWGAYREGVWLLQNDFDYKYLFTQLPYGMGGVLVRGVSLYPTFIGLGTGLLNPQLFIIVSHLLHFVMAALTIVMFYEILVDIFGKTVAKSGTLVFMFQPLFLAQAELVSEDLFILFFSTGTVYFLFRNKTGWACISALLAAFIKVTGLAACFTLLCGGTILIFTGRLRKCKKNFLLLAFPFLISLAIGLTNAKMVTPTLGGNAGLFDFRTLYMTTFNIVTHNIPYSTVLVFVFLASTGLILWKLLRPLVVSGLDTRYTWSEFRLGIARREILGGLFLIILGFSSLGVMYPTRGHILVRYLLLFLPASIFALVYLVNYCKYRTMILCMICILSIFELPVRHKNFGVMNGFNIDASREFRKDIMVDIKTAKFMEEYLAGKDDHLIVSAWPIGLILADPKLGYVKNKLEVVNVGGAGVRWDENKFRTASRNPEAIMVYKRNIWTTKKLAYDKNRHQLIKRISVGDKECVIYKKL